MSEPLQATNSYRGWNAPPRGQRRFNVMVKPIGPGCNLDCDYCYYLSKENLLGLHGHEPIADEILETFIAYYIAGNDTEQVEFEWQGGEPTLLGIDFFQKVLNLQKKHCPRNKRALNSIQTNGLLIDQRWCEFLRANRFLVGLSIDGPKALHDTYRRTKGRQPTFNRVLAAARLLKKHEVDFNTLTVINRTNVDYHFRTGHGLSVHNRPLIPASVYLRPHPAGKSRRQVCSLVPSWA